MRWSARRRGVTRLRPATALTAVVGFGLAFSALRIGPARVWRGLERRAARWLHTLRPVPEAVATEITLSALGETLFSVQDDLLDMEFPGPRSRPLLAAELDDSWLDAFAAKLSDFDHLEDAYVHLVRGKFLDRGHRSFEAEALFALRGRAVDQTARVDRGDLRLTWTRREGPSSAAGSWRLTHWKVLSSEVVERPAPLFQEALASALPDARLAEDLRRSRHNEGLIRRSQRGPSSPPSLEDLRVIGQIPDPSLVVSDLNGDGLDDLLIAQLVSPVRLLLGTASGEFVEATDEWGLTGLDGTSALLVDLDNDGDRDLVVGRRFEHGLVLLQERGRFVDRTASWAPSLIPPAASSLSAADFDGDGRLDIFVSTYFIRFPEFLGPEAKRLFPDLVQFFEDHPLTSPPGPSSKLFNAPGEPNLFLFNQGTRLHRLQDALPYWRRRMTYQASFADADGDGDPDGYIANDFSPDTYLENAGSGAFRETADRLQGSPLGFGMGASWADFDEDGDPDLYVSNMDSKAGRRITASASLDPRQRMNATGNVLYENLGEGTLRAVIGGAAGDAVGARAGWSWGGHALDIDLDGLLDLHVPNGHYTPPLPLRRSMVDT